MVANCTASSYIGHCTVQYQEVTVNTQLESVTGTAAGVPFLAVPPASGRTDAPVVVAWHLLDPPRTEAAFASALPLDGLDAWRIYLGLPMTGARLPEGGDDEIMRLGYEDAVLNLFGPISDQAAAEFPAALAALRERFGIAEGPVGLLGGSHGSAVAQLVLLESAPAAGVRVDAAVLVSPIAQLRQLIAGNERRYGVQYDWSEKSLEVAGRLDFVARAAEFAGVGQPAVRLIAGGEDAPEILEPAQQLRSALAEGYDDPARVDVVVVDGMGHELAAEPGIEPEPQNADAAAVDRHAVDWLRRYLAS